MLIKKDLTMRLISVLAGRFVVAAAALHYAFVQEKLFLPLRLHYAFTQKKCCCHCAFTQSNASWGASSLQSLS